MQTNDPTRVPNSISRKADPFNKFGWLGPVIESLGNTKRWTISMNQANNVIVAPTFPLTTVHESPAAVLDACRIAVQGAGTKALNSATVPSTPADTTFPLATRSFGARVRISNSPLNFKFGNYTVNITDTAGGGQIADVIAIANKMSVDFVVLFVSNVAGLASVIGTNGFTITYTLAGSSMAAGDVLYAESLNMRDLGIITTAPTS
jgi:hypothetical protein